MEVLSNMNVNASIYVDNIKNYGGIYSQPQDLLSLTVTLDFTEHQHIFVDMANFQEGVTFSFIGGDSSVQTEYKLTIVQPSTPKTYIIDPVIQYFPVTTMGTGGGKFTHIFTYNGTKWQNVNSSLGFLTENNIYTSHNVVTDGETYTEAISGLDNTIGLLKPSIPESMASAYLSPYGSNVVAATGCRRTGANVPATNLFIVESGQLKLKTSSLAGSDKKVYDPEKGSLKFTLDTVEVYSKVLTSGDKTETVSDDNIFIASDPVYDAFSRVFDVVASIPAPSGNDSLHTAFMETTDNSSPSHTLSFYAQPISTPPSSTTVNTVTPNAGGTHSLMSRIAGIPVLRSGDSLDMDITTNDNVWYFVKENIATVSGKFTGTITTPPIAITPNAPLNATGTATTSAGVYGALNIDITAYSPDGTTSVTNHIDSTIMVDTVTLSPYTAYTHNASLNTNSQLMLFGGKFQYPFGNWNSLNDGQGGNYSDIDYSSITSDRYQDFTLAITDKGNVCFNISDGEGFTSSVEPDSTYSLMMKLDAGSWLDGNKGYVGIGVVSSGEGCLVANLSSPTVKTLTFGTLRTGTVTVRLIMKSGCTKKVGQTSNLTSVV